MWIILISSIEIGYIMFEELIISKLRVENVNRPSMLTTTVNNRASFFLERVHNIKLID